jgi:ribonuclease Z
MSSLPLSVLIAGSGAVRAHPLRGGPCFVLRLGDRNLVFDCGRCAVHNLSRFGVAVENVTDIFITHLHFDHVCDLPLLLLLSWNNGRTRRLPITGPKGIADFLDHGLRQAYAHDIKSRTGHGKNADHLEWDVTELTREGVCEESSDCVIDTLITKHGGLLNFNYRLRSGGRTVVVMSDSEPDPRIVEFCRDADLVLIECSGTKEFYATVPWGGWHATPEEVGALMRDAGVKQVVLKHLVIESFRGNDPRVSEAMAEKVRSVYPQGQIHVAADGMTFDL